MSRVLPVLALMMAACAPETLPARSTPVLDAAPPPALALSGTCPGPMSVTVSGASAQRAVSLYWSGGTGSSTLATGPCAGRVTNLGGTPYKLGTVTSSASGTAGGPLNVPGVACSGYFQILDEATCTLSAALPVSTPIAGPVGQVTPASPSPCDDLVCSMTVPPPDRGSPYTYDVTWTRDGLPYTGGIETDVMFGDTISSINTLTGSTYVCTIHATDAQGTLTYTTPGVTVAREELIESFTITQAPVSELDLLMVVDNSCSMTEEQLQLAPLAPSLMSLLQASGTDAHIGVVTTDMANASQSGKLQEGGGFRFFTNSTPNGAAALSAAIEVGTSGHIIEEGLSAAHAALTAPLVTGFNAGFRRPSADLAVLFLSDEPDQSPTGTPPLTVASFVSTFQADAATQGYNATMWPLVGPAPLGCSFANHSADVGSGYLDLPASFGGLAGSVCADRYDLYLTVLAGTATGKPQHVRTSRPARAGTVDVLATLPSGQNYFLPRTLHTIDPASGAVVFGARPPHNTQVMVRYEPTCGTF